MTDSRLTLVKKEEDDGIVSEHYTCSVEVTLAGDSIWDCTLDKVTVTNISVNRGVDGGHWDGYLHVGVAYTVDGSDDVEDSWRMYTDSGFERAISELLGFEVGFTEQGMQDDNYASME